MLVYRLTWHRYAEPLHPQCDCWLVVVTWISVVNALGNHLKKFVTWVVKKTTLLAKCFDSVLLRGSTRHVYRETEMPVVSSPTFVLANVTFG